MHLFIKNTFNYVLIFNCSSAPIPDFKRGYTGHEHLELFGLVNMNFRFYDPHLGRFITPDNLVVDRTRTQSYNLYSYVLNNPLKYTDPTRNVIVEAMFIGAFINMAQVEIKTNL